MIKSFLHIHYLVFCILTKAVYNVNAYGDIAKLHLFTLVFYTSNTRGRQNFSDFIHFAVYLLDKVKHLQSSIGLVNCFWSMVYTHS